MSIHFDQYKQEAYEWLHVVADSLGIDDLHQAERIFRSVLHAVRDRLPAELAVHLGSQLPILWKGIYYDGFTIHEEPVKIRNQENWLEFIRAKDRFAEAHDFPTLDHAEAAFKDVMIALQELISPGLYEKVCMALPYEIAELAD